MNTKYLFCFPCWNGTSWSKLKKYPKLLWIFLGSIENHQSKEGKKQFHKCKIAYSQRRERKKRKKKQIFTMNRNVTDAAFVSGC